MPFVLHFDKTLEKLPEPVPVGGFLLRNFADRTDAARWTALRNASFVDQNRRIRPWTEEEFCHEIANMRWWKPENCWLIEQAGDEFEASKAREVAASVILAERTGTTGTVAAVHWLMVRPQVRKRGLGRWLLTTLEHRAWELGHRQVHLETHSAWQEAIRFYRSAGYVQLEQSSKNKVPRAN